MVLCHDGRATITFSGDPVRAEVDDLVTRVQAGELLTSPRPASAAIGQFMVRCMVDQVVP